MNHIRDSRLTCFGNRLDAVAYQARIISSHDVSLDLITSSIEKWISSSPVLPGWNSMLNLSSTWHYGLKEDSLYVECSSQHTQTQALEQRDNQATYNIILIAVVILVVLILAVVVLLVIHKFLKRKRRSTERYTNLCHKCEFILRLLSFFSFSVFNFKISSVARKHRMGLILRLLIQEPILVSILLHCNNLIRYSSSFSISRSPSTTGTHCFNGTRCL